MTFFNKIVKNKIKNERNSPGTLLNKTLKFKLSKTLN